VKIAIIIWALALASCQDSSSVVDLGERKTMASDHQTVSYSAKDLFASTSVFGSSISKDGSAILVTTDESGIFNVYRQPVSGDKKKAITQSVADAIIGVSFFPADDRILLTADQEGNELNHLYVRELDGSLKDITPGDNVKANFTGWVSDRSEFYLSTNERNEKYFDLYRYQTADYSRQMVFRNDAEWAISAISDDGRWVAIRRKHNDADSDIYVVDLTEKTADPVLITAHVGNVEHFFFTFTRDSQYLVYGTDEYGEYVQAWRHNLSTEEKEKIVERNWDVTFLSFSSDGRYSVTGTNADASTKIEIVETATGEILSLPDLPTGDMAGVNFSNDSKTVAFYINADNTPANLYVYHIDSKKLRQLTQSMNPKVDPSYLVESEVVRFPSDDDLDIPGLLYKPTQASSSKPVPALIWIHGGPGGQSRKGYRPEIQHLVNHGYAVLAVNNRGSSGYGKTFYHLDDRRHGEADLADIVNAKYYLQSLAWVEPNKIGVIGGSYGGYLTMAAMAFTDEFQVGVNIFGVMNWERTLQNIPPWWESIKASLYDEMGDPAVDQERHRRISPLFHAANIQRPILVVQGANDPRVLQIESDEMVAELRKNEIPVEYVLFPDEGHGFRKKANRITAQNAYLSFLKKYL